MKTLYLVVVKPWRDNMNHYRLAITADSETTARFRADDWMNTKHGDKIVRVEAICTTNDEVNMEL